jgi:hypothetical protein
MNHNIFNDRRLSDIEEQAHPDSVGHEVPTAGAIRQSSDLIPNFH